MSETPKPVAYRREFDGDESDLGCWIYVEDPAEFDPGYSYDPLYSGNDVAELKRQRDDFASSLIGIAKYFESGNAVPVDRSTIRRDSPEMQAVFQALKGLWP